MSESPVRLLNLGCGERFHHDWVNVDFQSSHPFVLVYDLRRGIPFPSDSFDFVYHSHVLEHFRKDEAPAFLRECHRVTKAGGTIRVAVPDLEQIARLYLHALEKARSGDTVWRHNYEWMMIELYDQTVRECSGGEHGQYLSQEIIPNLDFVVERHGREAERSILGSKEIRAKAASRKADDGFGIWSRLWKEKHRLGFVLRNRILAKLLGDDLESLRLGRFRRSGEVHQWMYDTYSLSRALIDAGYMLPRHVRADESRFEGWSRFCLDTEPDGRVYKPDSIFVEAIKKRAVASS